MNLDFASCFDIFISLMLKKWNFLSSLSCSRLMISVISSRVMHLERLSLKVNTMFSIWTSDIFRMDSRVRELLSAKLVVDLCSYWLLS